MTCALCDQLEAELMRLERVHAEKMESLRSNTKSTHQNGFQAEESAARINVDFARLMLDRHKQKEHKTE